MPRPVPPTADPTNLINSLRNTVRIRSRDKRTFHAAIGTRDMPPEDLAENLDALMRRVVGKLERGRFNIQSAYVKTTMRPAVKHLCGGPLTHVAPYKKQLVHAHATPCAHAHVD